MINIFKFYIFTSIYFYSNSFIKYNLNTGQSADANSNVISLCAYFPPYFPILEYRPITLVFSHHSDTLDVNVNNPTCFHMFGFLPLKLGLYNYFQVVKKSNVLLLRNQFLITSATRDSSLFLLLLYKKYKYSLFH